MDSKTVLVHGLEADWIEKEIMDGDQEFLKDVLEQKIVAIFKQAGINQKVKHDLISIWSKPNLVLFNFDFVLQLQLCLHIQLINLNQIHIQIKIPTSTSKWCNFDWGFG